LCIYLIMGAVKQGPMLWALFLTIFANFLRKSWRFSS
jgi:hypothetical protein